MKKRERIFTMRLTDEEYNQIARAAYKQKLGISEYVRRRLRKTKGRGYFKDNTINPHH